MIIIPMAGVKAVNSLVALINQKAGETVAVAFLGGAGKKREAIIQDAREYRIKALVGTLKITSTGINIPRASCLYEVAMSSNKENAEQRMRRVLTPMDDKPPAMVRYFLDDMNVRKNCMRNEYFNVMVPIIKPHIPDDVKDQLTAYFNSRSNSNPLEL
jgi:superfamily II DNA or RNA helicase